jgi:tetratricopeptide (TPR) repeat protein
MIYLPENCPPNIHIVRQFIGSLEESQNIPAPYVCTETSESASPSGKQSLQDSSPVGKKLRHFMGLSKIEELQEECVALFEQEKYSEVSNLYWWLQFLVNDYDILYRLGKDKLSQNEYSKAVKAFQIVLDENPDHIDALSGLGEAYAKLGLHEDSINFFVKSLKEDPESIADWLQLGDVYFTLRKYTDAIYCYGKALEIAPDNDSIDKRLTKAREKEMEYFSD